MSEIIGELRQERLNKLEEIRK
mgnify:CR=1